MVYIMAKRTAAALAVSIGSLVCTPARTGEPAAKADYKTQDEYRREVQAAMGKYEKMIQDSEDGYVVLTTDLRKKRMRIDGEVIALSRNMADPEYPAEKCRDQFVAFVRRCYTEIAPRQRSLPSYHKTVFSMAKALYCLKGETAGMYEVTKLSGYSVGMLHRIVDNPRWGKDPKLLQYELWCMKKRIFDPPQYETLWTNDLVTYLTKKLVQLQARYGTENELLKEFCMNHPFNKSTKPTYKTLTLPRTDPHTPDLDLDEWLQNYYSKLIAGKYDEAVFLVNVHSHWGATSLTKLFLTTELEPTAMTPALRQALLVAYLQIEDATLRAKLRRPLEPIKLDIQSCKKRLWELE